MISTLFFDISIIILLIALIVMIIRYIVLGIQLRHMEKEINDRVVEADRIEQFDNFEEFDVAGISHYKNNIKKILEKSDPSESEYVYKYRKDYVLLIHEPNNEYDHNAIAVYMDKEKIGYVPANLTKAVAKLKKQNKWFIGSISNGDRYTVDGIEERHFKCKVVIEDES